MLRAHNPVLRCAQPASRRLLRITGILTKMLSQLNGTEANKALVVTQIRGHIAGSPPPLI